MMGTGIQQQQAPLARTEALQATVIIRDNELGGWSQGYRTVRSGHATWPWPPEAARAATVSPTSGAVSSSTLSETACQDAPASPLLTPSMNACGARFVLSHAGCHW